MSTKTFGSVISEHRKDRGLSQKELAAKILKEDGAPISPQYLNDLEHDRRDPPADHLLQQFAKVLGIPVEALYAVTGQVPADVRDHLRRLPPDQAVNVLRAFRKSVSKPPRGGSS